MRFNTILVPTDLSPHSLSVAPYAAALAVAHEAKLLVAYVVKTPQEVERARQRLARYVAFLPTDMVDTAVEVGSPAPTLLDVSARCRADLVVVASHGRTGISRLLMGSTATELMRSALCPVMVLKSGMELPPAQPTPPETVEQPLILWQPTEMQSRPMNDEDLYFAKLDLEKVKATLTERQRRRERQERFRLPSGTVVVATDFSEEANAALELAHTIVQASGARLVLLHVLPASGTAAAKEAALHGAWTKLTNLAAGHGQTQIEIVVPSGSISHSIVERSWVHGAGLIVMGTAGRKGASRWLMGSTAEGVFKLASCPLVTVRAGLPAVTVASQSDKEAALRSLVE